MQVYGGRDARLTPGDGPIDYHFGLTHDESGAQYIPMTNDPPHGKTPSDLYATDFEELRTPAEYSEFGPARDLTFDRIEVHIQVLEFSVKKARGISTFESVSCLVRARELAGRP